MDRSTASQPTRIDAPDGRRARRDRNRDAVVDALLQCYDEGQLKPSVADIAERSGVSHRSVFRYFDDMEELTRVAINRGHERYDPLYLIHEIGKGPFELRIERIVEQRISLYETMAGPARVARLTAPFRAVVQSDLIRIRLLLRSQLAKQFETELSAQEPSVRSVTLASLDVLCSFESYELLRHDQNLTRERITETLSSSIRRLLAPVA